MRWRGRKIGRLNGYPSAYWPAHPMAYKNGSVYIHKVVAFEKLGRTLEPGENVHHKDGNRENWARSNIEVVDASLHGAHHAHGKTLVGWCACCGEQLFLTKTRASRSQHHFCDRACLSKYRNSFIKGSGSPWPPDAKLKEMVWSRPATHVARNLGVSSVAIKKRCDKRGIDTPGRGYWRKK